LFARVRRAVEAWRCVKTQVVPGFAGPVGCSYAGWKAALELHPEGLWTWDVFRDLRVFEEELVRACRERSATRTSTAGDMERHLLDTYGDDLREELEDAEEDPHRG